MAYTHKHPIVPHSRPSFAMVDGRYIRPGSWGPLLKECKAIEAWGAKNRPCGPYTVDYLPGGDKSEPMWKVFRDDEFMRYADTEDIQRMAGLLSRNDIATLEDDFLTPPELLIFSSKGNYKYDPNDLDEAFGATPKYPVRRRAKPVDDLDEAFGGAAPDEGDPFDPYDDDLDEAFS